MGRVGPGQRGLSRHRRGHGLLPPAAALGRGRKGADVDRFWAGLPYSEEFNGGLKRTLPLLVAGPNGFVIAAVGVWVQRGGGSGVVVGLLYGRWCSHSCST